MTQNITNSGGSNLTGSGGPADRHFSPCPPLSWTYGKCFGLAVCSLSLPTL